MMQQTLAPFNVSFHRPLMFTISSLNQNHFDLESPQSVYYTSLLHYVSELISRENVSLLIWNLLVIKRISLNT